MNETNLKELKVKLKELDEKIAEVNKRMPAHSVKPPIMNELFELEDEREAVVKQINELKKRDRVDPVNSVKE
jgi:chorismate mutase